MRKIKKVKQTSETATTVESFLELGLWSVIGLILVKTEEVELCGNFRHVLSVFPM